MPPTENKENWVFYPPLVLTRFHWSRDSTAAVAAHLVLPFQFVPFNLLRKRLFFYLFQYSIKRVLSVVNR